MWIILGDVKHNTIYSKSPPISKRYKTILEYEVKGQDDQQHFCELQTLASKRTLDCTCNMKSFAYLSNIVIVK